ncbi:MAG: alpha/beta hydrolase [Streptosporangiales bacterium]|nr:alpha/beta hydrolase [Streptosporangiales bacterium]
MHTELVTIPTDTVPLDGAFYRPDEGPVRGGVLLFHGNTTNFYSGPPRFLPQRLVEDGFACLAFNRRGHDVITTLEGKRPGGGAFQTAAEGIADNEYAAAYLAELGFDEPAVIGHSNGGMLGADFAARHPEVRALVLLSAHAGGPDTYLDGCAVGAMAADRADEYLERARQLVADGHGDELLLMPGWWFAISATSLLDRHENTPDLLKNARSIRCPSLFLVGDAEPPHIYPAVRFAECAAGRSEARILEGCDHWYTGLRTVVADMTAEWLCGVFPGA